MEGLFVTIEQILDQSRTVANTLEKVRKAYHVNSQIGRGISFPQNQLLMYSDGNYLNLEGELYPQGLPNCPAIQLWTIWVAIRTMSLCKPYKY